MDAAPRLTREEIQGPGFAGFFDLVPVALPPMAEAFFDALAFSTVASGRPQRT
jgi:hypothetical protein